MTAFQDSPPPLPDPTFPRSPVRPVWPKVLGIISVCLAGLALMSLPMNAATSAYMGEVYKFFPPWYKNAMTWLSVIGIPFFIAELVGGILLLKQRPAARWLLMIYCAWGILAAIANTIILFNIDTSLMPEIQAASFKMSKVFAVPLGLAYPVFLIVWFSRSRIRREVKSWKAARGQL